MKRQLNNWIPAELWEDLDEFCKRTDRKKQQVVAQAIENYLWRLLQEESDNGSK